jgi:Cu-Zn family superoxide dismutase
MVLAGLLATLASAACSPEADGADGESNASAGNANAAEEAPATARRAASAMVIVRDAGRRELGRLTLTEGEGGIAIAGRLAGLAPGDHGMHLHAVGRCDPPSFESAGSHWNPSERQHGSANPQGPHAGDLPNVAIGADSAGIVEGTTSAGSLFGDVPLLDADGAALIVHAGRDDYSSQPSGGAGAPVACGVVEAAPTDPADSLR